LQQQPASDWQNSLDVINAIAEWHTNWHCIDASAEQKLDFSPTVKIPTLFGMFNEIRQSGGAQIEVVYCNLWRMSPPLVAG
jgi:hypothetical protein